MSKGERVSSATLKRLIDSGEAPEFKGPGAWDGMNALDLALDLVRARSQRDRYLTHRNALRRAIAHAVSGARAVIYELAGRELRSERIVTKRLKALVGRGTKPYRRGMGGGKKGYRTPRKGLIEDLSMAIDEEADRVLGPDPEVA